MRPTTLRKKLFLSQGVLVLMVHSLMPEFRSRVGRTVYYLPCTSQGPRVMQVLQWWHVTANHPLSQSNKNVIKYVIKNVNVKCKFSGCNQQLIHYHLLLWTNHLAMHTKVKISSAFTSCEVCLYHLFLNNNTFSFAHFSSLKIHQTNLGFGKMLCGNNRLSLKLRTMSNEKW